MNQKTSVCVSILSMYVFLLYLHHHHHHHHLFHFLFSLLFHFGFIFTYKNSRGGVKRHCLEQPVCSFYANAMLSTLLRPECLPQIIKQMIDELLVFLRCKINYTVWKYQQAIWIMRPCRLVCISISLKLLLIFEP